MKRSLVLLSVVLALCLSACASSSSRDWYVYLPVKSYIDGPALAGQSLAVTGGEPSVEELINALLKEPTDPNLYSPFPAGVALRSWHLKDGLLSLTFSEQYGGLSGIQLTLADYSIALTLCQLEQVDGVSVSVVNDSMPFRHHQILTPEDVLISDLPAEPEKN